MEWFAILMPTICTVNDVNHQWSNSTICFDENNTNLVGLHYSLKKCHLAGQLILHNFGNSRRGIAPLCWFGTVVLNMQNICQNIFFCQIKSFWKSVTFELHNWILESSVCVCHQVANLRPTSKTTQ